MGLFQRVEVQQVGPSEKSPALLAISRVALYAELGEHGPGGTEGMLGGAQDWHKVQLDHQSQDSSKDAPPKLPKRIQCGLCRKSDGHNRKTCPQLRDLCGQTLLSGSEPTVQELPRSEPPTRK
jgi:hypothetical protein